MAEVEPLRSGLAGATNETAEIKGKIVEYAWYLKKKGRSELTIDNVGRRLNQLAAKGLDLTNPEDVKDFLAKQDKWSNRTKALDVCTYDGFLRFLKIQWEPPEYKPERKPIFIPTEEELDQLIAASGRKQSVLLQLLKETAVRFGEAVALKWNDVDFQRKLVNVTAEKGSNPRILPISSTLAEVLSSVTRKSDRIFAATASSTHSNFYITRKSIARRLGNPRLLQINFHTFRHWKLTMLAHETHDPLYVQEFAGHRDIKSTMLYIHLEKQIFQNSRNEDFHVATAKTVEDASKLIAVGFEYVHEYQGVMTFRKRK